jgi:tetratricopeptide (TPR) repeat protein
MAQRATMDGEVTADQARRILDMLTQGGAMEDINTPLALRLIPLALELEDEALAGKLLAHAKTIAADDVEIGWATFEQLKMEEAPIDALSELAAHAETMDAAEPLAAAIAHHVSLLHMSNEAYEEAQMFASRSLRLREAIEDENGIVYGLALLEALAKKQHNHETALVHGSRRIELLMKLKDEEGQMEAMADMGHSQATLGQFDAAKDLYTQSLDLAVVLEDLSGQLVARWGLADIAEIEEDYETAMLQLSDCLHAFINAGLPTPIAVRQRIEALTDFNSTNNKS